MCEFSAFPMFVPSLSWQRFGLSIEKGRIQKTFPHLRELVLHGLSPQARRMQQLCWRVAPGIARWDLNLVLPREESEQLCPLGLRSPVCN